MATYKISYVNNDIGGDRIHVDVLDGKKVLDFVEFPPQGLTPDDIHVKAGAFMDAVMAKIKLYSDRASLLEAQRNAIKETVASVLSKEFSVESGTVQEVQEISKPDHNHPNP